VAQGPETFETSRSSGTGRKVLFSILGVVVVVGLGIAIWLLFIRDSGPAPVASSGNSQQAPGPPPAPSTKPLPAPPPVKPEPANNSAALVEPPGSARNGGGEFDLAKLKTNKLLPDSVVQALEQGAMTSGLLKASTASTTTIGLYALSMPDSQGAATVAQTYANAQKTGGLPSDRDLSLQGVPVYSTATGDAVFRAVYIVYNRVVIFEAFGGDRGTVQTQFKKLLTDQVENAPPTQRSN
jgi:hypothetical protein